MARVETLEKELTKAKKEAAGREEHMKAARKNVEEALAAMIVKEAVARARVGTLEDESTKFRTESVEREVLLRDALAAETTKETFAREKLVALEDELVKSRKEGADSKDRYVFFVFWRVIEACSHFLSFRFRQAENRAMLLQDRYDAQAVALRMAKEHSVDLQVRRLMCLAEPH